MVELTDHQIDAALDRGAAKRSSEPRATSVRFNAASERLVIELSNGCSFTLPARLVEGLAHATTDQLKNVEMLGSGYGLHWPQLDIDVSVPGLLSGIGAAPHPAAATFSP